MSNKNIIYIQELQHAEQTDLMQTPAEGKYNQAKPLPFGTLI